MKTKKFLQIKKQFLEENKYRFKENLKVTNPQEILERKLIIKLLEGDIKGWIQREGCKGWRCR